MISKVILIGKIQESKLNFTEDGVAILRMIVRTWENGQGDFHKVVLFDPTGERAYKYNEVFNDENFDSYVYIDGTLRYRSYTDKNNVTRKITEIVARTIRIFRASSTGKTNKEENGTALEEQTLETESESTTRKEEKVKPEKTIDQNPDLEELEALDDEGLPF